MKRGIRVTSSAHRRRGLYLIHRFGLVLCPNCRNRFLIVKNRQRIKLCDRCHHRFWVVGRHVNVTSNNAEYLNRCIDGIRGWHGAGKPFVPTNLLYLWIERWKARDEPKCLTQVAAGQSRDRKTRLERGWQSDAPPTQVKNVGQRLTTPEKFDSLTLPCQTASKLTRLTSMK